MRRGILAGLLFTALLFPPVPTQAGVRHHGITRHYLPPLFVTGYVEVGYTASGVWTHPGTCATDWAYIPKFAHVHVPGVGTCRVEDTGGAIKGYRLDWWYPTVAQCYAVTGWYRGAYWTR